MQCKTSKISCQYIFLTSLRLDSVAYALKRDIAPCFRVNPLQCPRSGSTTHAKNARRAWMSQLFKFLIALRASSMRSISSSREYFALIV